MMTLDFILTLIAALGCGLVAGVLFAFSSFIMTGLARLPPEQGILAMQSINITVINFSFMTALFGTAMLCVAIVIRSAVAWNRPGTAYALAGAALYLLGTIAVTAVFHVPRNDALAALDPNSPQAAAAWRHYVSVWTAGNHLRTAAALVAGLLLILSLHAKRGP